MSISSDRRRLSVGVCDPVTGGDVGGEGARGLVKTQGMSILEAAGVKAAPEGTSGRRQSLCMSSTTDKDKNRRGSFAEKDRAMEGCQEKEATTIIKEKGIGFACRKGMKPESPNQDSFTIVHAEGQFQCYGVYDGHGPNGHDVSQYVKENLMKCFLSHPKRDEDTPTALTESFEEVQKSLAAMNKGPVDPSMSGSTVTVLYMPETPQGVVEKFFIAHCGDSRGILLQDKSSVDLTIDHKPNLPEEKQRIEAKGGRVVFDGYHNYRVFAKGAMYPGLNMSRALGDVVAHRCAGLSGVPDVKEVSVTGECRAVIIATDGVWEFIESKQAYEMMSPIFLQSKDAQTLVEDLVQKSWDAWMEDSDGEVSDDITAIYIPLMK